MCWDLKKNKKKNIKDWIKSFLLFYSLHVFHTSFKWCFFCFCFYWKPNDRKSPLISSPVSLPGLWEQFQAHQLQLIPLSLSCPTAFSALWQDPSIDLYFCFLLFPLYRYAWKANSTWSQFLFFLLRNTRSHLLARI